jgi:hypothetical protein
MINPVRLVFQEIEYTWIEVGGLVVALCTRCATRHLRAIERH